MHAQCAVGSRHSLKTLNVENVHDVSARDHNVIYRPLLTAGQVSNTLAAHAPADCALCVAPSCDHACSCAGSECYATTPHNQRLFQTYPAKQSNIRNNLSLKLQKSPSKPRKMSNKQAYLDHEDTQMDPISRQPRGSVDGDVILHDLKQEPKVLRQTELSGAEIETHNCLLNNTL